MKIQEKFKSVHASPAPGSGKKNDAAAEENTAKEEYITAEKPAEEENRKEESFTEACPIMENHTTPPSPVENSGEEHTEDHKEATSVPPDPVTPVAPPPMSTVYGSENFLENENDFPELLLKIKREINLMLFYALHSGKKISEEVGILVSGSTVADTIKAHRMICDALAPATPETIAYISTFYQRKKQFNILSPIPLVRNFTLITIIAIISIVASSLSPEVSTENLSKGVLNNHGLSLLINLIFLSSASLMGAAFFLLSKLTRAVKEATLSPDDSTYYWAMLIMGILSGMILSEGVSVQKDLLSGSVETNRLIFAILGGFSSEIVYKILQSIMQKIQSAIAAI